jgi:hypothetical protein
MLRYLDGLVIEADDAAGPSVTVHTTPATHYRPPRSASQAPPDPTPLDTDPRFERQLRQFVRRGGGARRFEQHPHKVLWQRLLRAARQQHPRNQ